MPASADVTSEALQNVIKQKAKLGFVIVRLLVVVVACSIANQL